MFWWLKTVFASAVLIYGFTLVIGLLGNSWVVASLFRTTKKASTVSAGGTSLSPSDRLRKYIWLLALLDMFVNCSLIFRIWSLLMPEQQLSDGACQWMFAMDQTVKLCSLTCLACISIERFITIRKPFNNKLRRVAVQLTPLFALLSIATCGASILWLSFHSIGATEDGLNCTQTGDSSSLGNTIAGCTLALGFCAQLGAIESNYLRIVIHVRRKFWQRKARAVASSFCQKSVRRHSPFCASSVDSSHQANSSSSARLIKRASPPLLVVAEPRYMRDMTAAISRIATFHLICWLPFCLLHIASFAFHYVLSSDLLDALRIRSVVAARIVNVREQQWTAWLAFVISWLTYFNSAGNWVLYAALNRDLRSVIKACSERRKRSTMSHQPQTADAAATNLLTRSMRRTALHSLRFFYSLNSHRSSAASVEADFAEAQSAATTIGIGVQQQQQQYGGNATQHSVNNACSASPRSSLRAPSCSDSIRRKHSDKSQCSVSSSGGTTTKACPKELGTFGWRNGRAHTYCSPSKTSHDPLMIIADDGADQQRTRFGTDRSSPTSPSVPSSAKSVPCRIAHQIIAAIYGDKSIRRTMERDEGMAKLKNGGESEEQQKQRKMRRESAQEKRELFAQMHSPLPPIVVSTSASIEMDDDK